MSAKIIDGLENLTLDQRGCVLTIGNFDGVHQGHQRILEIASGMARAERLPMCVMTFDPDPHVVLDQGDAPPPILPKAVKYRLLGQFGADVIVVVHTTSEFLATPAEDFVRRFLPEKFAPRYIVEGPEFFFGSGRGGSLVTLWQLAAECGLEVIQVPPTMIELPERGRVRLSSSLVRFLLGKGAIDSVNRCLGRRFALYGKVVGGEQVGRVLAYPTANVDCGEQITPCDGVYAGFARIGRKTWQAAISIGIKPTFGGGPRTIEANLLDAQGDFYDKDIEVEFITRLRGQEKFADAESLRAQIAKDVQRVRELCK